MTSPNIKGLLLQEKGEEDVFCFDLGEDEDDSCHLRWCLMGRFLCDRLAHVRSMKVRVEDMWSPVKAVTIKQANEGLFLFHFFIILTWKRNLKEGHGLLIVT
ncbi:unnamed protein product [Lathyrus oleraceus]